jgi:hypothetical protein
MSHPRWFQASNGKLPIMIDRSYLPSPVDLLPPQVNRLPQRMAWGCWCWPALLLGRRPRPQGGLPLAGGSPAVGVYGVTGERLLNEKAPQSILADSLRSRVNLFALGERQNDQQVYITPAIHYAHILFLLI